MVAASRMGEHPAGDRAERLAATKRAIPLSRMIDYGMTARDAASLHALAADDATEWSALAEALAGAHLSQAQRHADAGRDALCRLERERAAAAYNIGQLAIHRDNETKRRLYALTTQCLAANANDPGCDYRRLVLPADDGRNLYAWDFPVRDPAGCVVMFGGLSGWGASFMGLARALNRRGIRTILAEAPGQGETRLVSGLHLSRKALSQAMRFVELAADSGQPAGIIGFSFGGLIAAHLAAAAPHVAALCTNGSPVAIGALNHPAEREQFAAAFGAEGAELLGLVSDFNFDASVEVVRCPVLALEGGADPLVAPGTWRGFVGERHEAADAFVWEDGLHTLYNHAGERDALIAAWLSDCFRQSTDN